MNTGEFFELIWPTAQNYVLCHPIKFTSQTGEIVRSWKHFVVSGDAAADVALSLSFDGERDVYYAMGVPRTVPDTKNYKGVREQSNIAKLKTFWIDIDVGVEAGKYPSRKEAASAIQEFVRKTGLPKPFVVSSGRGFHVYWPMDTPINASTWTDHAQRLKALATSEKLRQDPTRTADCASVLRPVGTLNWKGDTPTKVEMVFEGVVSPTEQLLAQLRSFHVVPAAIPNKVSLDIPGDRPIGADTRTVLSEMEQELANASAYTTPDPKKIIRECRQMEWQFRNQGDVPEPLWYAMIACMRHSEGGVNACRQMSRNYPGFDNDVMMSKIDQLDSKSIGPTLCSKFEDLRPGGCEGCPHKGKVKTPLTLGRELKAAPPPLIHLDSGSASLPAAVIELPPPPTPFKRAVNPDTGHARITMTVEQDEQSSVEVELYPYDIFPVRRIYQQREGRYAFIVRSWLPMDGWREFEVPGGKVYDKRSWYTLLGDMGVMIDLPNLEDMVQYMIGYIKQLQKVAEASVVYAQLGWSDGNDKFVMPDKLITRDRTTVALMAASTKSALKVDGSYHEARGDIEIWKRAVHFFTAPGREAMLFTFGTGFGAPLFHMTGFSGMMVNVVGAAGAGKSLAVLAGNTVWGHGRSHWLDLVNDTAKSAWQKIGTLHTLPAYYDEITNIPPKLLGELAYRVSNGRGRARLNQDASFAENYGDFRTMLVSTSNASLHAKLSNYKVDASAEAIRVFEYVAPSNLFNKSDGTVVYRALMDNYGLAAEPFIRAVMQDVDAVKTRVQAWVQIIDQLSGVDSNERFWSAAPAAVLTAFEITNQIGLTRVSIDRLKAWAVETIQQMRGIVDESMGKPSEVIDRYLREHINETLVLTSMGENAEGRLTCMVTQEPRGELRIRKDTTSGKVYIDRAHFRAYCTTHGIEYSDVKTSMAKSGVLISDDVRMVLSKGTPFSSGQTRCLLVDVEAISAGGTKETPDDLKNIADLTAKLIASTSKI